MSRLASIAIGIAGFALVSPVIQAQGALAASDGTATLQTVTLGPSMAAEPQSVSQVRIVRLSEIRGQAEVARNSPRWEPAFANIPLVTGNRLRTLTGVAEVEFEDNSTLRLTPDTVVEFAELGRAATGATVTKCNVLQGTVYITLAKSKADFFTVTAGEATVGLNPGSHIRLETSKPAVVLAVLGGSVEFSTPAGSTTVTTKRTLRFNTDDPSPTLAASVEKSPFDAWDKQETEYQVHNAGLVSAGGSGSLYGSSDLNYYGSFANLGSGCGNVWRPYFASAAWDPYGSGVAAWYPGAGYSWVSPYPWGWLPYHTGSWQFCGAGGWGWQPGGSFQTVQNWPRTSLKGRLPTPPVAPRVGAATLLPLGARSMEVSRMTAPDTFTFRSDSAGLGVPREVFGKLGSTSAAVAHHGMAQAGVGIGFIGGSGMGRSDSEPSRGVPVMTRASSGFSEAPGGPSTMAGSAPASLGPGSRTVSSATAVSTGLSRAYSGSGSAAAASASAHK